MTMALCHDSVVIALCLFMALAFGGLDQYVGSFSAHPLGADVSGLSAPWLVLPFVFGATQATSRRAALLGLGTTLVALVGYMLMTFSPLENAHLTLTGLIGFLRGGNMRWFGAGVVTGPVFAWLGYHWRARRAMIAGLAVAALVCLEPFFRHEYGNAIRSTLVATCEVAAGMAFALAIAVRAVVDRSRHQAG
ncbi:MAG TPA: DUF6518 family protein [Mycobacteriales bacterium]|nr:DUF6518 family protein [Mycobacteriales bacterium]